MASINKLSVRGIRAFSPDDEEQVISFGFPLTIIIGANGCGKTTIIEALKFAITGSLPPGNKSGQAFCNDPKACGHANVKASVKVRFTSRAGKSMVVVRSLELTQKKSTLTFKTLDGIIRTTDDQGNRQSMSHKCTELDRVIPLLLGVPKAVLEHVVFCHQEESSWPLMEGAVLKKRFDDIFDSTRYVKALEELKEQKKKYTAKVKDHKIELAELEGYKHAAVGLRADLDACRQGLSDIADEIEEYNNLILIEQKKVQECNIVIEKDEDIKADIEETNNLISQEEARIETLRGGLTEDLSHKSKADLEAMVAGFDQNVEVDRENLRAIEREIDNINKDIKVLMEREKEKTVMKGSLIAEKKINDDNCQRRLEIMEELATRFGLELSITQSQPLELMSTQINRYGDDSTVGDFTAGSCNIAITDEDIAAFEESIQRKRSEIEGQLKKFRESSRIGEDEIQAQLNEFVGKIKSVENDIERLKSEEKKVKDELKSLPSIVLTSATRKSDIDDAKDKVKRFIRKRDELNDDQMLVDCPRMIREKEEEISKLKGEIEDLDLTLRQLRQLSEERNEIDMLKKQIHVEKELIDEVKKENSFLLQKFGLNISTDIDENALALKISDAAIEIGDRLENAKYDLENSAVSLKTTEGKVSELKALLSHNKTSLSTKTSNLVVLSSDGRGVQKIKNAISSISQYERRFFGNSDINANTEPQDLLQHCTKKIGELTVDDCGPETVIRTIDKLIDLGSRKNDKGEIDGIICPCCAREFENEEQITVYSQRMNELRNVDTSPIILRDQTRAVQNLQAQKNYENWRNLVSSGINDWLDFKRITLEVESLNQVISKDKDELKKQETTLRAQSDDYQGSQEDLCELQQMLEVLKRLKTDAEKMVTKRRQINSKEDELALMAPSSDSRDLRVVEREYKDKVEKKDALGSEISSFNKKLSELNKEIQTVSQQVTQSEKMLREKEDRFAQEQRDNDRRMELTEILKRNGDDISKLEAEIDPIRRRAKEKETERSRYRSNAHAEEEKLAALLSEFNNIFDRYSTIHESILMFSQSEKLYRLTSVESELDEIESCLRGKKNELKDILPKLEESKKYLAERESVQKNIERNIELKSMLEIKRRLYDDVTALMAKRDVIDFEVIRDQLNNSQSLIRKYEHEKSRRDGSKDTLLLQEKELKRKIQTKEYKDIDERHRVKLIEVETCDMAARDLDIYYNALDKSLLRYHSIKIADINKIVKELWSLTYKGEDITSIRLTSDQDESSKAARSYNYRVVMTKGTSELDMRGRCSAGQRVLASIVIRLALAETFCINCGVMALDEPTTNLDYANKRGLAAALAQIISHRATQNNFQLITITHDEEFVSMMKNELAAHTTLAMPERYFQVCREESSDGKYYSKIHALDWDDI